MITRAHPKKHFVSWNVRAFALSKITNMSTPVQAHRTHIHHFRHVSLPTLIIPYFLQYKNRQQSAFLKAKAKKRHQMLSHLMTFHCFMELNQGIISNLQSYRNQP